ncbi:MAG: glycosyltransferase involved in cell wall biosynthesis [Planctomycetota bacterium]|jgi:glycosyltransferase involved in cell wall biosynthesis
MGFQPDVIVAYGGHSAAGVLGARSARRLGVPLVLVEEGALPSAGAISHLAAQLMRKLLGSRVRRQVSHLVALNAVARAQAIQQGYGVEQIEVLPPGVDLERFRPGLRSELMRGHGVRGHTLLVTRALEADRGLEQVLDAFANTVGRREDWALVFAGDGPHRAALHAQAARLGVGAHVHWIGALREEELPGLFGSATLLLVPGPDSTRAAQHLRCAAACGLPAIAVDEVRFSDLVENDRNGLLVNHCAGEDWVRALERAAGSPKARERWGERARELAEERFAWPTIAARFAELLGDVSSRKIEPAPSRRLGLLRRRA